MCSKWMAIGPSIVVCECDACCSMTLPGFAGSLVFPQHIIYCPIGVTVSDTLFRYSRVFRKVMMALSRFAGVHAG